MSYRFVPVLLACLGCLPAPALPQALITPPLASERTDLGRLVDQIVPTQLFLYDIPGASVALVGNGKVLHLGGYGLADLESRTPVSAEQTLFGTGSVSKSLTWTAVMQFVEQDQLALDRDVNAYLTGLQIPATWPQPVTLAHLLTHTAGFEQRAFGFYARSPASLIPLQRFLAEHLPARSYPPGKVSAYSNYGAALAGHLLARTAGIPFERVIETRILEPLGMTRSTFRQPLPPELAADLATGYRGKNDLAGYGWYQARPSAAFRTTAADMARFMLAHLQQGDSADALILQPESLAAMQQRQFSNHPAVSGLTYGYQELQRGGQRILWQSGDTLYYSAALFLLPESGFGLFVAYNRAGVRHARLELLDVILAYLRQGEHWPEPPPAGIDSGTSARVTGHYRSTRSGETSLERLFTPFSLVQVVEVRPGTLQIRGLAMVESSVWLEQAPGVFRDRASEEIVVFEEAKESGITWLFEGNAPAYAYSRLPWHATPAVQFTLLACCGLLFLSALIAWPLHIWRRRPYVLPSAPWPARIGRMLATALGTVNLVFMGGLLVMLGQTQLLLFGVPPLVHAFLLLPVASATLSVVVTALVITGWRKRYWALPERLHFALLACAGMVFLGVLYAWRLL